jgi:hypothetical protein
MQDLYLFCFFLAATNRWITHFDLRNDIFVELEEMRSERTQELQPE